MKAVIETADTMINIRRPKAPKELIKRAADALGMNSTQFMLETLCEKAHEVLSDRTQFQLSQRQLQEFNRLLDRPVSAAVLRMLAKPAPWE